MNEFYTGEKISFDAAFPTQNKFSTILMTHKEMILKIHKQINLIGCDVICRWTRVWIFWGWFGNFEILEKNWGNEKKLNFQHRSKIVAHKTCLACKISNVLMSTDHAKFPLIFSHVNRKHTSCLLMGLFLNDVNCEIGIMDRTVFCCITTETREKV
jgi:hypothetical protein